MNSLANTKMFNAVIKTYPEILNILKPDYFQKYVVPFEYYELQYKLIQSRNTKGYPLIRPINRFVKEKRIELFNMAEPTKPNLKQGFCPNYIIGFIANGGNGKKVSFVNAQSGMSIKVDKSTGILNSLNIGENYLYAYLQAGATALILNERKNEIEQNIKYCQLMAEAYSTCIGTIVNEAIPIASNIHSYDILKFLSVIFFLQYHMNNSVEKSLSTAFNMKTIDVQTVKSECDSYKIDALEMKSIDDFIACVEREFSFIKRGSLSYNVLAGSFAKKFGNVGLFAVEHCQSFIQLMQFMLAGCKIANDWTKKILPINNIERSNDILASLSGV